MRPPTDFHPPTLSPSAQEELRSRLGRNSPEEQLREIKRGAVEVLPEDELLSKLERSYTCQTPLRIKLGADPSRADLHLGHTVLLTKLRSLQEFGHEIQFLIGDFTGRIGDPTGRDKTRAPITIEAVNQNAHSYREQVFKILDPELTSVYTNSSWLEPLTLQSFLNILTRVTVSQLLSREDFAMRYEAQTPIFGHEFLYPILQAQDSVALCSDLELGGSDQKFNLLMGRHLQKLAGQEPQAVLMMPILEGLSGNQKMSKSLDNYVGLNEEPESMFGKLMSISDPLLERYLVLLSLQPNVAEVIRTIHAGSLHPMEAKKRFAAEIVDRYHNAPAGAQAREVFENRIQRRSNDDLPEIAVNLTEGRLDLLKLITAQNWAQSNTQARRLLAQKAIHINEEVITSEQVVWSGAMNLKVGKRIRVRLIQA